MFDGCDQMCWKKLTRWWVRAINKSKKASVGGDLVFRVKSRGKGSISVWFQNAINHGSLCLCSMWLMCLPCYRIKTSMDWWSWILHSYCIRCISIFFHTCVYGFQNSGDCCNINILLPGISQTAFKRLFFSFSPRNCHDSLAQVVLQDVATKSHPWTEICSLTPGDQRTLRMVRGMSWDVELIYIWRLAIWRKATSN